MELAAGLDFHGPNFNADSDTAKQLESLTLKSQSVDMPTTFAVACLRGDQLVLSPLNEALQMRPQLNHLATSKKKDQDEEEEPEEEKKPDWVAVRMLAQRLPPSATACDNCQLVTSWGSQIWHCYCSLCCL